MPELASQTPPVDALVSTPIPFDEVHGIEVPSVEQRRPEFHVPKRREWIGDFLDPDSAAVVAEAEGVYSIRRAEA